MARTLFSGALYLASSSSARALAKMVDLWCRLKWPGVDRGDRDLDLSYRVDR